MTVTPGLDAVHALTVDGGIVTIRAIRPVDRRALAGSGGVVAVDAKLRLTPVGVEPDPRLRRLSTA